MSEQNTPVEPSLTNDTPLIVVDGSSYLYRAYHALPPLATSSGQPTGAIKGVIAMLRKLQADYSDSTVIVVFDAPGPTFREALYPAYKAHRPPMPDDLQQQIAPLQAIIQAMGLPLLCIPAVEADDVIGTLAYQATQQNRKVLLSSGDKDLAQLVNAQVTLVNTMTDTIMDSDGVITKFGVSPALIVDYLALTGDKVDNIPGVPGIGAKTAVALLQHIGGLTALYANLARVTELAIRGAKALPDKLSTYREQAYLSYQLATIRCDVDLGKPLSAWRQQTPDHAQLLDWFTTLEFNTWRRQLADNRPLDENQENEDQTASSSSPARYITITQKSTFRQWLKRLQQATLFAFDTETTSLDIIETKLVGVSFAVAAGEAAYVPVAHDYLGAPQQLDCQWVLAQLQPVLEDEGKAKVGQNIKYDQSVLARYGIELRGQVFDTMLASYLLNATATRHDLDSLAQHYLNRTTTSFTDIAGKGTKQLTFNQIALDKAAPYAAEDADVTLQLHQTLWPQLAQEVDLCTVFNTIEQPLVAVLSRMERHGALVDGALLAQQSQAIGQRLHALEQQIHEHVGEPINLNSPKQLQAVLFDKLGLPVIKKTPKGQPSTAEEVLQELALDYALPELILAHRGLSKLKSTYTDKLPRMISPVTGRIHTSYHQAVTATGRLSSSDPNLQNIPIRTAEGRKIRQAFIASTGYTLVAADYSQIELRIMAHLSDDQGLLSAFAQGLDIHQATAAEVFGVPLAQVSAEQRRRAKAINFGLIYGMSAFGLARQLGISRQAAQAYSDRYFQRYPGVLQYMETTKALAKQQGYVQTLFGRRLYLPAIQSRNGTRQQAAERTAINAPLQGTAADIIKKAMIAVDQWLQSQDLTARMILQVHDELVLEVADHQVASVIAGVQEKMAQAATLTVPLVVSTGSGHNWDEAH